MFFSLANSNCFVVERLKEFLQFNTISESDIRSEPYFEFPSVTICNHNLVSKGQLVAKQMNEQHAAGSEYHGLRPDAPENFMMEYYESVCEHTECSSDEMRCIRGPTGCCISMVMVCDGYSDCMDDKDESNCPEYNTNSPIGSDDIASGSGDGAAPEVGDGAAPEGGDDSAPKGGDGTAPGSGDGTGSNNSEEGGIDIPSVERQTESNTTTSSQSNSSDYTAQSLDFDLASMLRISGWQLHDRSQTNQTTTLLDCTFDGIKCNSKWFEQVLTEKSVCYTFNHPKRQEWLSTQTSTPIKQWNGGSSSGLQLMLDARTADYMTNIYTNLFKGLIIRVHSSNEKPDMRNSGIYLSVGFHTNIALSKAELTQLEEPWGRCDRNARLKYSPTKYTYEGCFLECKVEHVINKCDCLPYYIDLENAQKDTCDYTTWITCGTQAILEVEGNSSRFCNCNPGCIEKQYQTQTSQSQIVDSLDDWKAMNSKYYKKGQIGDHSTNNHSFYRDSVVSLNVYFKDIRLTTIKQKKALDELALLSEFGGMLGLFMGLSLLTVVEIIEAIVMACYKYYLKGKYRRPGVTPSADQTTVSYQ